MIVFETAIHQIPVESKLPQIPLRPSTLNTYRLMSSKFFVEFLCIDYLLKFLSYSLIDLVVALSSTSYNTRIFFTLDSSFSCL